VSKPATFLALEGFARWYLVVRISIDFAAVAGTRPVDDAR
jgi:hypothetical protein